MPSYWGHQDNPFPPKDPEPILTCPACGELLYPGDTVFRILGEIVGCEHCVTESEVAV